MKILLLSTYFRPDVASTGVIMTKLSEEFAAQGHEVTVVTSVPHYDPGQSWPAYSKGVVHHERRDGMHIYRVRICAASDRASIAKRMVSYGSFSLLSALRSLLLPRHDIVLIPSPPLSNGILGDLVTRFRGTPFIYNVQDIWPDVAVRAGILKSLSVINQFKSMERYVYRRAAKIAVISEGFRQNLLAKGVPDHKISVIPNFIDTEFITPQKRLNSFSARYLLDDKFVVLFAGNMGFSQGLDTVIEAAKLLQGNQGIKFLMVGNGAARQEAERLCESARLGNVEFLPFQSHSDLPILYGAADVCLIPLKRGFTAESVPCKLLTIMSAGKPAIASVDPESETSKLIQKSGAGICVDPEDPPALAEAINRCYSDRALGCKLGNSARGYAEVHFRSAAIAQKYLDLMHAALTRSTAKAKVPRVAREGFSD